MTIIAYLLADIINIMNNLQIAELLRDVASSYQLKDQNKYKFQIIAYQRAADAVEHATSELKDLWDDNKLTDVPGIGPSIAEHLGEIFKTGKSKHFEELMKDIPKDAFKLMELPGIGIKTALRLIAQGKPSEVKDLLKQVDDKNKKPKRILLPYAMQIATEVIEWLKESKDVKKADTLGSLRRCSATIGDIDIAVATDNPIGVIEHFVKYPKKLKIIEQGDKTASILLPGDVQVDILPTLPDAYGAALQHFTGSKHHNIALREHSLKKGLSLNEYGIKKLRMKNEERKNFKTEEEFYKFLGLDWVPPELREDTGEIEAAREHKLPKLVELQDINADLQIHSSFDIETSHDLGASTMEEVIKSGNQLGYEYLAFTEHNPSQKGHTDEQITEILKMKKEKVEQINYSLRESKVNRIKKVFNSLEIDMKSDGTLPVPDSGLATLDFALVSIHSSFDLERSEQTRRVLQALSHPKVKIFAHPTGRKLNEREGAELNWPEIFAFALANNKWIEINCDPMRLDLPDTLVRDAVKLGVKLTLGTDSHHAIGLTNMIWGVNVARRGWAEKKNIMNCLKLSEFEKELIK